MTTREFLKDSNLEKIFKSDPPSFEKIMIEFAQYHVKQALEAASKKATIYTDTKSDGYETWDVEVVDKDTILDAYPESNII